MIFVSLLLSLSMCISSSDKMFVRNANISEKTKEIISLLENKYDLQRLPSFFGENDILFRKALIDIENDNFFDQEFSLISNFALDANTLSSCAKEIESCFLKTDFTESDNEVFNIVRKEYIYEFLESETVIAYDLNNTSPFESTNNNNDNSQPFFPDTTPNCIPLLNYSSANASVTINGSLNNQPFVGLKGSKDACIAVYNSFASFANGVATGRILTIGSESSIQYVGILGAIINQLAQLQELAAAGLLSTLVVTASSFVQTIYSSIMTILSSIWTWYVGLFCSGGIIGVIIGILIAFAAAAVLSELVLMIIYGSIGRGFAHGWIVNNIFSWTPYNGDYF